MDPPELAILPFDDSHWDEVLAFADSVVPFDLDGNREWLANRQRFDATGRIRRHYAALDRDGCMIAYGAIEQQPDGRVYRLFIVPSTGDLWDTAGQALFQRVSKDLSELGATLVWMREYAQDVQLVRFAQRRGFVQVDAFDLTGPNGTFRIVRLEKRLDPAVKSAAE